ncbi:MAG: GLPGLI family protein [Bacteroidetes bacterium]|nr:MAG: GLPGLI family protein [Bacteroidota bacterium]TAG88143.1 MAG: GLPGLI family protein [Bacteroidota bacterium]
MKKNILFIFLSFTFLSTYAQNIAVDYKTTLNTNEDIITRNASYRLLLKDNQSIYFNDPEKDLEGLKQKDNAFNKKIEADGSIQVNVSDNHIIHINKDIFYKNYTKDSLIFNDKIVNKKAIIGESINLFKWKIIAKSDTTILTYKCQKATCDFRGRKYVAYFSKDLYTMGGPWKFDGLPGLILYVYSEDNYFIIEPQKIAINQNNEEIKNPYTKEKIISWKEYKKLFEKKIKKIAKLMKSKFEDGGVKISDKIEDLEIKEIKMKPLKKTK